MKFTGWYLAVLLLVVVFIQALLHSWDANTIDFLRLEGKTVDEAKATARMEYSVDWVAYLEAEKLKNRLSCLRDDLATKISVLQSFSNELRQMRFTKEL